MAFECLRFPPLGGRTCVRLEGHFPPLGGRTCMRLEGHLPPLGGRTFVRLEGHLLHTCRMVPGLLPAQDRSLKS